MNRYKYIFVVLVYKNTDVLTTFFESLMHVNDYKVVLVNAYYDEETKSKCQQTAREHNADFVDIPNKGYGGGNNEGIDYAYKHYEFEYLIISNSDIIIKKFTDLKGYDDCIVAPDTIMISGKKQNPNMPSRSFGLCYFFLKQGFKRNNLYLCRIAHAINRISRILFTLYTSVIKKESYNIYSAHGSCFVIGKGALDRLCPLFDAEMFLYNEELYVAIKCRANGIKVKFAPNMIQVLHLEGASAGFDYKKQFGTHRESFLILDGKVSEMW